MDLSNSNKPGSLYALRRLFHAENLKRYVILRVFIPPRYDDPIENVFAKAGNIIFLTAMIVSTYLLAYFLLSDLIVWTDVAITVSSIVINSWCSTLIHRKKLKTAISLFILFTYLSALVGAFINFGIENIALHTLYPVFIMATVFLGPRFVNYLGVVTILSLVVMYFLTIQGVYAAPRYEVSPLTQLLIALTMIAMTILMSQVTFYQLVNSNLKLSAAKDEAESASRLKSAFLANMSHELRTPLNAIIGYSEGIIDDAATQNIIDPEYLTDVEKIHLSGRHLLTLISDILDLSKIEADKVSIEWSTISLPDFANEIGAMIKPLVAKNGNQLLIDVDPNLHSFRSDEQKLNQIMLNLLSNASKFTHNGIIRLHISETTIDESRFVQFEVADSGIGIPPDQIETIFDSFAQVDDSFTRGYEGTGLGLTITKKLTQMLGGEIEVTSVVGEGTEFKIILPI